MSGGTLVLGLGDCERTHPGLVAQPVNTATSLAYVAVGAWLLAGNGRPGTWLRQRRTAYSLVVLAAGAGSVAYHGPGTSAGHWLHDLAVPAVAAFVVVDDLAALHRWPPGLAGVVWLRVLTACGAILLVRPSSATVLAAVCVLAAALAEGRLGSGQWPARRAAYGLLAAAAVADLLGRTGSPFCNPDSLLQLHGVWHVLSALAMAAWAGAAFGRVIPTRTRPR
jgi:hypothetical protein